MQKIDSHQHFWQYDAEKHSWIDDSMVAIRKNFLPDQLHRLLLQNDISGCIAVQADETEEETNYLLSLADKNPFIKGIVGWVDMKAANIKERLQYYQQFKLCKGFRYVLQNKEPGYMLQPGFILGVAALEQFNFTYDLLILPVHLTAALTLVKQFPRQKFVIDHIAKPTIKSGLIDEWKKDIQAIALQQNVFCKISGMVTEADHTLWKYDELIPYLDVIVKAFGTKRIMYGSDWPVCLLAADYTATLNIVTKYFAAFSPAEQEDFFGNNAAAFYQLQN